MVLNRIPSKIGIFLQILLLILKIHCNDSVTSSLSRHRFGCRESRSPILRLSMMSAREIDLDEIPLEIKNMLSDKYTSRGGLVALLPELLSACRTIGTALRDGTFTADKTGTENPFGDQQLDVDVQADKVSCMLVTFCD
jgi:hypothetical protein